MNQYIITPVELRELLNAKVDVQLIDVRTSEKHQAFNIGGALIPLEELPNRLHELDATKPIITYCTSGNRSMRALEFLLGAGFEKVKSLDGGMRAWPEKGV